MTTRRDRWMFLLAALALSLATAPVHATDRYFADRKATSPEGRWRLEAKSPDNASERPQPFARNFTYTFTDTRTGRVLWTRKQPQDEGSPTGLYVHDSMWVVVQTAYDDLFALAPVTGEKRLEFDILDDAFTEADRRYVHNTTAGPMWEGRSHWYFLEREGRVFFVIRTWWDRRVVADLTNGKYVAEVDPGLAAACEAAERDFVLKTLEGALERLKKAAATDYEPLLRTFAAVHLAGRLGIKEAVPLLRQVQHSDYVGSSGGWFDFDNVYKSGDINPFNVTTLSLRRAAHLALRKLGEKPDELPCTSFNVEAASGIGEDVKPAALSAPRAARVALLKEGMTPREVLDTLGAPDYVNFGEEAWEYDMDAEKPFTLRLKWKDKKTVDRWQQITPPRWQDGETRYEDD